MIASFLLSGYATLLVWTTLHEWPSQFVGQYIVAGTFFALGLNLPLVLLPIHNSSPFGIGLILVHLTALFSISTHTYSSIRANPKRRER